MEQETKLIFDILDRYQKNEIRSKRDLLLETTNKTALKVYMTKKDEKYFSLKLGWSGKRKSFLKDKKELLNILSKYVILLHYKDVVLYDIKLKKNKMITFVWEIQT